MEPVRWSGVLVQKNKVRYIALISFFFSVLYCKAQKVDQFNSWWFYSGEYSIDGIIKLKPLYAWSRNEFVKNWQQSKLSIGIHYVKMKNTSFGAGYEWIILFPYGAHPVPKRRTEHRIFESVEIKNKVANVKVSYGIMLEQRIFSDRTRHRARIKLGGRIPVTSSEKVHVSTFNTVFLNVGNFRNHTYFNQNRVYLGLETAFKKSTSISLGYMNQYLVINPNRIENNHTLMFGLHHKLNFNGL